jgi:hypothetical protein
MRTRTVIALLAVALIVAGNAAVIGATDATDFSAKNRGAAAAQYRAPNQNACRALANRHEKSEDALAQRNRLTRSNRRSADRRAIRRARKRGASQRQIRSLVRRQASSMRRLQSRHRKNESAADKRNDRAAEATGCKSFSIDR